MAGICGHKILRWLRPTPDRLVLAVLALEGFLVLSERFQWFAFNQHKGWTVLIAVASVGVFFLLMFLWFFAAVLFRLRFQYRLRSLLLLAVVVAIPCSWLAVEREHARKQRGAVEEITRAGGSVTYDYELDPSGNRIPHATPPYPPWLRKLIGDDMLVSVTRADLAPLEYLHRSISSKGDLTSVADLLAGRTRRLGEMAGPHELEFAESNVDDAWLEHLKALPDLESVRLRGVHVSAAGVVRLRGLTRIQTLDLSGTKARGAELGELKALAALRSLDLSDTGVTDAGIQGIEGLTQLRELNLGDTAVGDAGLDRLKGLEQLQLLVLYGTKVTDEGVSRLQRALPKCEIQR